MKYFSLIIPYTAMAFNLYALIKAYEIISNKKIKISFVNIFCFLVSSFLVLLLNHSSYYLLRVIFSLLVLIVTYKIIFREEMFSLVFKTLIIYLVLLCCDFCASTIFLFFPVNSVDDLGKLSILRILCTILVSLLLMLVFLSFKIRNFINKLLKTIVNNKNNILIISIVAFIFIVYLLMSFLNATSFEMEIFSILILLMLFFMFLCIVMVFQYFKNKQSEEEQKVLLGLMDEYEKMLDSDRIKRHEMLNNLIIIKSFKDKSSYEFERTLNEIIDMYKEGKSEVYSSLYTLPSGLKGIIYYKMSKIKEANVRLNLFCSKDMDDKLEKLNSKLYFKTCKIIGILLDNAIEASEITDKKYLLIDIYYEKDELVVYVENSFQNDIEINSIYLKGVSSKGENRGYGLYIVNKIVEDTEEISLEQYIENNNFVSILKIKNPS